MGAQEPKATAKSLHAISASCTTSREKGEHRLSLGVGRLLIQNPVCLFNVNDGKRDINTKMLSGTVMDLNLCILTSASNPVITVEVENGDTN